MNRLWNSLRKVQIKQHDGSLVEIQRLPLLLTTPLLLVAAQIVFVAVINATEVPSYPFAALVAFSAIGPFLMLSFVFAIEIQVRDGQLIFGAWPFYVRHIPLQEVESWHPLTLHPQGNDMKYNPYFPPTPVGASDYSYTGAFQVPDRSGVELSLIDGRHVFIATAHPERLMHAIANAKFGVTA